MTINNMARNEIWKPIYKGRYEASNLGNIRSRITKRVLKPIQTKSHKQLQVWLNNPTLGYREQLTLSHLIYNAFSGEGKKLISNGVFQQRDRELVTRMAMYLTTNFLTYTDIELWLIIISQ